MPRITPVESAEGPAKALLDDYAARGGQPGPMVRAMANAPALLRGYMDLNRALKRTRLDRRIVERINLAVHEWLGCEYCLVAHTRAARALGLDDAEIERARDGGASDPAVAAIVAFARRLITAPADVDDAQIAALRGHGYGDDQIADVAGLVALQQLTGAFNLAAGIEPAPADRAELTSQRRQR
jgi:uncharacterized peroxidase-related enzyme